MVVKAIEANTIQPIHVLTDMVEMSCPGSVLLRESRSVLDGLLPYPIVVAVMENYQFGNLNILFGHFQSIDMQVPFVNHGDRFLPMRIIPLFICAANVMK